MIHLLRDTFKYTARHNRDASARDIKPLYTALTATAAAARFDELTEKWGAKHPAAIGLWKAAWTELIPFWTITSRFAGSSARRTRSRRSGRHDQSLNARFRRAVHARGNFPTDQAALKIAVGLLVTATGFPQDIAVFEGTRAATTTDRAGHRTVESLARIQRSGGGR